MAKLAYAVGLKSTGVFPVVGSSPTSRTRLIITKAGLKQGIKSMPLGTEYFSTVPKIVPTFRVHRRAILLRTSTTNFVYADRGERNRINKANLLVVNLSEKHDMGF